MSGLEPIAALSLACNILQVIGVGLETARIAKQVYQDGSLDPALKDNAGVLDNLSDQIRSITTTAAAAKPAALRLSTNTKTYDEQLLNLANKCQGAARDLQEEVNFLNGPPNKTKLVAVLKIAAKTTWRKRRLERLSQALKDAEGLLQTGLLTRVYEKSVTLDSSLSSLDVSLRAFFNEYREGSSDATELMKKHVTTETDRSEQAVKTHVTQTFIQSEQSTKQNIAVAFEEVNKRGQDAQLDAKRHRLLQSLKFDRMNERRNLVGPSHPTTFKWILRDGSEGNGSQASDDVSDGESDERSEDEPSSANNTWDSFSDWLRSTGTVYWISGNPGSGKSNLLKYLLSQPQLPKYLDLWGLGAVVVSHFFWRPGTAMQQSIRGLFCSLLYQLLLEETGAIDQVLQSHKDMSDKDTDTDWSTEELQSALHQVIGHYSRPIVLFIDGLDEVLPKDGVLRLLEVIIELEDLQGTAGKVKMCLGSRREPLLYKRLDVYPQLRLEQLNRADLRRYGQDKVVIPSEYQISMSDTSKLSYIGLPFSQESLPSRDELRKWLIDSLVDKAQGVFLWLCLTVTTVRKALNEDETVEDLQYRIQSLPADLADLYADMWSRMNHDNDHLKARAASYLQLALHGNWTSDSIPGNTFSNSSMSSYLMMVTTTTGMADQLLQLDPSNHVPVVSLIEACKRTIRESTSRCAGLITCSSPIEVRADGSEKLSPWHFEEYTSLIPYLSHNSRYSFLHRTAADFLKDTEAGQMILKCGNFNGVRGMLQIFKARLTICRFFKMPRSFPRRTRFYSNELANILIELYLAADLKPPEQESDIEFTRREVSQLFLICEQLFNYGYLCSTPKVPSGSHDYNEITVHYRYEFFIEASMWSHKFLGIWDFLLPIVKSRNVDDDIWSQLLVYACSFDRSEWESQFYSNIKAIEDLLGWEASPNHETLHHFQPVGGPGGVVPFITTTVTPFRALIMSIWSIANEFKIDSIQSQKLLDIISLFVAHGADLQDEVYITIEIKGPLIGFGDLWFDPYDLNRLTRSTDDASSSIGGIPHMILVLGCPASTVIARIFDICRMRSLSEAAWLSELRGITTMSFDQCQLIAVVGLNQIERPVSSHIPWTLFMADVLALGKGDKAEKDFLPLVRLAENGLKSPSQNQEILRSVLSHISVPLELQQGAVCALEKKKSENVPAIERRREVRVRLGGCTPLEEPDWQGNSQHLSFLPRKASTSSSEEVV